MALHSDLFLPLLTQYTSLVLFTSNLELDIWMLQVYVVDTTCRLLLTWVGYLLTSFQWADLGPQCRSQHMWSTTNFIPVGWSRASSLSKFERALIICDAYMGLLRMPELNKMKIIKKIQRRTFVDVWDEIRGCVRLHGHVCIVHPMLVGRIGGLC